MTLLVEAQRGLSDKIRDRVRMRFTQEGFTPASPLGPLVRSHYALGTSIWGVLQPEVVRACPGAARINPDQQPYLWGALPMVLAFGHAMADLMLARLGCSEFKGTVRRLASLFNAAACCVDRVFDVEVEHRPFLLSRLTEANVEEALRGASTSCSVFSHDLDTSAPSVATFACYLLDAFVAGLRQILNRPSVTAFEREELSASILAMLRAQTRSSRLGMAEVAPSGDVRTTLREMGSGPFRVMTQVALLTREERDETEWRFLSEEGMRTGDLFRWVDDLADVVEDFSRGVWTSVWVAYARHGGALTNGAGHLRAAERVLPDLLDSGIVDRMAVRIVRRATALDLAEAEEISSWMWAWLS